MNTTIPVNSRLYKPCMKRLPIVYRDEYNENDFCVYRSIIEKLGLPDSAFIVSPKLPTNEDLRVVHSIDHLNTVKMGNRLFTLLVNNNDEYEKAYRRHLNSEKYQTAGSILAGKLAVLNGWSINIGGGFHTSTEKYYEKPPLAAQLGINATYADITLLVSYVLAAFPDRVTAVMVIDLDACQGYGLKRDFIGRHDVFILDVYNGRSFPNLKTLKKSCDTVVDVKIFGEEEEDEGSYLKIVEENVEMSLNKFCPDLVVYVAGVNILSDVKLGGLSISREGLLKRDEIVFEKVRRERNIPIVTLMSDSWREEDKIGAFAESILNLRNKGFLTIISSRSHLEHYVNSCLDEICSIDGSVGFNEVVNNLCRAETIEEARTHWIPGGFYFPENINTDELSSLVLVNQSKFKRQTTPWETNEWRYEELEKIKLTAEHIDRLCIAERMNGITDVELIATVAYKDDDLSQPLYVEIVAECGASLSCNGTIIVSRSSKYFIQNLNRDLGEYCRNEIKNYILAKEEKEKGKRTRTRKRKREEEAK